MRLSVIITSYNYAAYVGFAIKSALALDWRDVEVIVVDDGSTDESRAVISAFGDRITAIFQPNMSQRVACNNGFARSTGDTIMFLDSDDMVDPSLAREVAAIWRPGISKVQFQMKRIDAMGRSLGSIFPPYKPEPSPEKISKWARTTNTYPTPPGSGNVYARSFLEQIFPVDDFCGPYADTAPIVAAPFLGDVVTVAKPLVYNRVHERNESRRDRVDSRFSREIAFVRTRCTFARRFYDPDNLLMNDPTLNSLPVLQFRIASWKLRPDLHPIQNDRWMRLFADAFRVPLIPSGFTWKARFMASVWSILTLLSPTKLARWLIDYRYKGR